MRTIIISALICCLGEATLSVAEELPVRPLPSIKSGAARAAARQTVYRYDFGETVSADVSGGGEQHVICDNCPPLASLAFVFRVPVEIKQKSTPLPGLQKTPETSGADVAIEEVSGGGAKKTVSSQMRTLGTIHFSFDKAEIKSTEKALLDKYITEIRTNGGDVVLEGYTCDVGPEKHNRALSRKRARAVSAYLRKSGITAYAVRGKGESTEYSAKAKNRRVEILLTEDDEIDASPCDEEPAGTQTTPPPGAVTTQGGK